MNEAAAVRPPMGYWVASALALAWTLIGVASYLMTVYEAGPPMSEAQRSLQASMPAWVMGAFAIAVFSGAIGSLGLLMRKRWAKTLLLVSLIAVLAQEFWVLVLSETLSVLGTGAAILPICVIVVAALLVWLASAAERKGWLV